MPAHLPVARLEVRLYHHVTQSISSISHAKYNPGQRRDCIVYGSTCEVRMPHAVTNSSPALRCVTMSDIPFHKRSAQCCLICLVHKDICISDILYSVIIACTRRDAS